MPTIPLRREGSPPGAGGGRGGFGLHWEGWGGGREAAAGRGLDCPHAATHGGRLAEGQGGGQAEGALCRLDRSPGRGRGRGGGGGRGAGLGGWGPPAAAGGVAAVGPPGLLPPPRGLPLGVVRD